MAITIIHCQISSIQPLFDEELLEELVDEELEEDVLLVEEEFLGALRRVTVPSSFT